MVILTDINKNNTYTLNRKKCIYLFNKYKNFISYNYNLYYEYKKFKDYFIEYYYDENKLSNIKYLNYLGKLHREDGPASLWYDIYGEIYIKHYIINDERYHYEDYILKFKKLS